MTRDPVFAARIAGLFFRQRKPAPPARETYEETLERERLERQLDYECVKCGGREFWLANQVVTWKDITAVEPSLNGRRLLIRTYANRFYGPLDGETIAYACKTCGAQADTFGALIRGANSHSEDDDA